LTFGGDICPENGEPLDTIEGQTDYIIRRLKETLEFADASLSDVINTIVFLRYIEDFGKKRCLQRVLQSTIPCKVCDYC